MTCRTSRELVILSLLTLLTVAASAGSANSIYGQHVNPTLQHVNPTLQHVNPTRDIFSNSLVTYLTLYGVNGTTGNVFAFVKAHDMIKTKMFNATKLDMMDNKTDGIAQTSFVFQNLTLKAGEPFSTCIVILNSAKMVCNTDNKTPFNRPQYVDFSLR